MDKSRCFSLEMKSSFGLGLGSSSGGVELIICYCLSWAGPRNEEETGGLNDWSRWEILHRPMFCRRVYRYLFFFLLLLGQDCDEKRRGQRVSILQDIVNNGTTNGLILMANNLCETSQIDPIWFRSFSSFDLVGFIEPCSIRNELLIFKLFNFE